jgi:transposase
VNYAAKRKANYAISSDGSAYWKRCYCYNLMLFWAISGLPPLTAWRDARNYLYMTKTDKLHQSATLNRHPDAVQDPLFERDAFFDPEDLVQVKYEMLRCVAKDGKPVSEAARLFGFSRPSFYKAQASLEEQGLAGLVPKKPGPRAGHKLTDEVLQVVWAALEEEEPPNMGSLAELVRVQFGIEVHPRSIERALTRKKKQRGTDGK